MLELECFTTSDNNAYRHWASKAVNQNMRQQDIVACRWQNTPTTYKTELPVSYQASKSNRGQRNILKCTMGCNQQDPYSGKTLQDK